MAGASSEHNLITGNLHGEIRSQLKGRSCRAYISDMRLRVSPLGIFTYPDFMALCGEPRFSDEQLDTLLNPMIIAEVLSTTTESYDRGDKFAQYRQLASLREYVLIAQDKILVELFTRQGDHWHSTEFKSLYDILPLASIGSQIALREIYALIEFSAGNDPGV
jgi:Uma2 family endonuclease